MTGVRVEVQGAAAVEARLAKIAARAEHTQPLMDNIGQALVTNTRLRFEDGISPDGVPWKPSIRARESGGKTLLDTGRLADSVTHNASNRSVEVGTNVIYGAAHQFGATIRAKGGGRLKFRLPGGLGFRSVEEVILPARPFLGISADDREDIDALADDFLMGLAA